MKDDHSAAWILFHYFVLLLLFSCSSGVQVREMPINRPRPDVKPEQPFQQARQPENTGSVAAGIRDLCDKGSLSALTKVLVLLNENDIEESEFGRVMSAVAVTLLIKVYDEERGGFPVPDAPKNHIYSKILAEAERGIYREPPPASTDYLEHILPFLALLDDKSQSRFAAALPDLEKARRLNPEGALAPYFTGFAAERMDKPKRARELYDAALALAPDCYPAVFGIARILQRNGQDEEAVFILSGLNDRYPGNIVIMRQLARAYFRQNDWTNARRLIDAALAISPQDPDMILMLARVLFEEGQFVQMQAILDRYAAGNPETRDYLLLRAHLQNEGFKNRENAISILRPLYKLNPDDFDIALYMTRLLLESNDDEEQAEGRRMLKTLMRPTRIGENIPIDVILLASEDAVRRSDWEEARTFQDRILSERRTASTLVNAFKVEQGAGDVRAALVLAEELTQNYPDYEEGKVAYAEALIDSGRHGEAQRLIDARIAAINSGAYKSRYYYLRGMLRGNFDSAVSDFRASLFENPRNLDALKALVELYAQRHDDRHTIYYLRQALAIAPKDPVLLRYQKEYTGKMQ
ncbi:MAG: tetratricopeptide repeat protein [Spirochaetaceae bacterium]|jgi:tetratricopeptide (TPR) repeat protein|nr:tetratricopeptide repeat protein [Spirochaetaceae bacterium]